MQRGVKGNATRTFITPNEIIFLLGCKKSKAYKIVRELNDLSVKQGNFPFPLGKANKYLFSKVYAIPIDEVNKVIERGV